MTKYKFTKRAKSEDALLFGHKICEFDWLYLGQDIKVHDKGLKKDLILQLYQVEIDNDYYVFGAAEIAAEEWVFYTQIS